MGDEETICSVSEERFDKDETHDDAGLRGTRGVEDGDRDGMLLVDGVSLISVGLSDGASCLSSGGSEGISIVSIDWRRLTGVTGRDKGVFGREDEDGDDGR